MNNAQIPASIAPIIAFFAGLLAGKGVFGFDAATWTIILGGIGGAFMAAWGAVATRKIAVVAAVDAMAKTPDSGINGVITAATPAGKAIADAIPGQTVAMAGSFDASVIAKQK